LHVQIWRFNGEGTVCFFTNKEWAVLLELVEQDPFFRQRNCICCSACQLDFSAFFVPLIFDSCRVCCSFGETCPLVNVIYIVDKVCGRDLYILGTDFLHRSFQLAKRLLIGFFPSEKGYKDKI